MASLAPPLSSNSVGPSTWDDVVPTLRKRLETESAYINNRLSTVSNTSGQSHSSTAFPSSDLPISSSPRRNLSTSSARTRLKSTPLSAGPMKSSIPALQSDKDRLQASTSSSISRQGSISPVKTPSYLPSRIPTRPRSKSQLSQRPLAPLRIPSNQSSTHSLASSNGMRQSRSKSPHKDDTTGRESLELGGRGFKEGMIKNELPPFMMFPEEAMRIATGGHDLGHAEEDEEESLSKRKRAVTMRNGEDQNKRPIQGGRDTGPGLEVQFNTGAKGVRDTSGGMSTSASGLGIGHPTQDRLSSSTKSRSSSSRTPASTSANPNTTYQPRSVSLNMLASSPTTSRLAHLVPPEQTYKPPAGVNWDDVVIPTVAKKLAAGQRSHDGQELEEGDLAIEWDKDGTPVKWVKWNASPRLDTSVNSNQTAETSATSQPHGTKSTYPPSFDPSAENPLLPNTVRQQSSYRSIRSQSKHHLDTPPIELAPVASHHLPSSSQAEPPVSPAPFSSLIPRPADWVPPPEPAISRKPSLLKKNIDPRPLASRQASAMSIGTRYQQQGGGQSRMSGAEYFSNPRPVPAPPRLPVGQAQMGLQPEARQPGRGPHKQDEVSKGCGCVVM